MSDNLYDVKRILDCRRRGSRTQYLVDWAHSWVYREDLDKGCDQLIHEFQVSKQTTDGRTVQQSGAEENVDTEDKENLDETEEESDLIIADIEPKDEDTAAPKDQKREEDSGLDIADIGLDTESEVQSEVNETDEWKPDDEVSDSVEETADSADEYNPKKKKKAKASAKTKPMNQKKSKQTKETKPKAKVTKKKPKVTTGLANKSAADSGSAATSSVDLKSKTKKKRTFVPPLKSKVTTD